MRLDSTYNLTNNLIFIHRQTKPKSVPPSGAANVSGLWSTDENRLKIDFSTFEISFGAKKSTKTKKHFEKPLNDELSTKNFLIKNVHGLHCPACGKPLLTPEEYKDFKTTLLMASEHDYIDILGDYKECMQPMEKTIFEEIQATSNTNNNKPLRAVLKILRNEKLPNLQKEQLAILDGLRDYVDNSLDLLKDDRSKIFNALYINQKMILDDNDSSFQRKAFINSLRELDISDKQSQKDIIKITQKLPESSNNIDAWIVKYSGKDKKGIARSSQEIAETLLEKSETNVDHMLAQNVVHEKNETPENGQNAISNYMLMHTGCNSDKRNIKFIDWYNEAPKERKKYITTYFIEIQRALNNGKITDPQYKNYVLNAIKTIKRITKGQVTLDYEYIKQQAVK